MTLRRRGYLVEAEKGKRELTHLEIRLLKNLMKKALDIDTDISRAMATKFVKWGFIEWPKGGRTVKITKSGRQVARAYSGGIYVKVPK